MTCAKALAADPTLRRLQRKAAIAFQVTRSYNALFISLFVQCLASASKTAFLFRNAILEANNF